MGITQGSITSSVKRTQITTQTIRFEVVDLVNLLLQAGLDDGNGLNAIERDTQVRLYVHTKHGEAIHTRPHAFVITRNTNTSAITAKATGTTDSYVELQITTSREE